MTRHVTITKRAAVARLKRALAPQQLALRECRPNSPFLAELGRFYVINLATNSIDARHVDLEQLLEEEGCIKPWEALEE